jgi:hypothetical protein
MTAAHSFPLQPQHHMEVSPPAPTSTFLSIDIINFSGLF